MNKKILFQLLTLLALASILVACGGNVPEALEVPGAEDPAAEAGEGAATDAPAEGATEAPAEGAATEAPAEGAATEAPAEGAATEAPAEGDIVASFKFTNAGEGAVDICQLYVSPTSKNEWGVDQLNGATLAVDGEFTLTDIPAGSYDIKGVACDGTEKVFTAIDIVNK